MSTTDRAPASPTGSAGPIEPAGEDAFLAVLDRWFPDSPGSPDRTRLRGDDCAVLDCPPRLLMSTDLFFEDVHFRTRYFSPEEIGHKALAVNVSDIAAMGGRPLGFSLGLGLPPAVDFDFFSAFCAGMSRLAAEHGLYLSGGDLSAADRLLISVTIWGGAWPENATLPAPFLRRAVAEEGDRIFCAGRIGLARAGLALLESDGRAALQSSPLACAAHLTPRPKVTEGRILATAAGKHGITERIGLMDVSDGLARDLPRLIGPGLGAAIERNRVPLHPEMRAYALSRGLDPALESVIGGEDYALAGTCPPESARLLEAALPDLVWLGTVIGVPGVFLDGKALGLGFDHFSKAG